MAVNNNNHHDHPNHHLVPIFTVNLYAALIVVLVLIVGVLSIKYIHLKLAMERYTYWTRAVNASQVTSDNTPDYANLILDGISYQQPGQLQSYVSAVSKDLNRDVEVVDTQKKVIADKFSVNIGLVYSYDKNNEVTQTLRDGVSRKVFERSPDYPDGIWLLVLPIKNAQGAITAALLIQTPR